jgi:DNA-binding response OmpR family regulator
MARILIIDDDHALREMIAIALKSVGHLVTEAEDGEEGLRKFKEEPPDIVITDLVMPHKEGLETITDLKKDDPALPIIAMSGSRLDSHLYLDIAGRIGARVTLSKPFTMERLFAEVNKIIASFDNPSA